MIILSNNVFNVNERFIRGPAGEALWRISLTTDAPMSIDFPGLLGLAAQLDLTQADLTIALGTDEFPPQLIQVGQPSRPMSKAQWAYKPAVAALIGLQTSKEWEDFLPE